MHAFDREYVGSDDSFAAFRDRWERLPETFVVYIEDGEIIADATGKMAPDGDSISIESIGVHPDRRGEGIGSEVLAFFEQQARQYSDTITVASADNVEGFYRAHGYEPEAILLQVATTDLPDGALDDDHITDHRRPDDDAIFLYAGFEEYTGELRDRLKAEFNAFEVNTILEKKIK